MTQPRKTKNITQPLKCCDIPGHIGYQAAEACHNDGNCLNDAPNNLRWDTVIGNKSDMVRHGTRVCGEMVVTAKLTEADVREIRRVGKPLRPLAKRYGITEAMVSLIIKRKAWKHVI